MGDKTVMQLINSPKLNSEYIRKARLLIEETIEKAVFGLYTSVATNVIAPGAATAVSDLNIRQGISALKNLRHDVLKDGAFFVTPTIYYNQLAGIAKYYSRDISGMNLILKGNFGEVVAQDQLYGVKVFVTTNIVSTGGFDKCLLAMPEAFSWASHMTTMPRVQSKYLVQNLGTLVVVDAEYGVGVLRESAAVLYDLDNTATVA